MAVDGDDRRTDGDGLARLGQQLDHGAGEGTGQLDDGLLGLHLDEDLVQRHLVAHGDVPGHELGLRQPLTQVGQEELPDGFTAWRHRSTSWRMRSASGRKWRSAREAG